MTKLLIVPGDGIGPEITAVVERALIALNTRFELDLDLERVEVGQSLLKRQGTTMPPDLIERARAADGVILGPLSTADYPPAADGGHNVSARLRRDLDLYANIRPSRARAGIARTDRPMDLIIVRENSEGFFSDRIMAVGNGEFMPTPDVALALRKITVRASQRIAELAFAMARERRCKLVAVNKRNVFKISDGLFLRVCREVGQRYPDVEYEEVFVDAMAALLIRCPERFDIVLCTNLFGDILSDEAGELSGSLGLAASLNSGVDDAVAQAVHGSAPDIAGRDIANPSGLLLATVMLLRWLARRASSGALSAAADGLEATVERALADPARRTVDLGGTTRTSEFGRAIEAGILGRVSG
ncbi:MAG: isocitrate/isopropylmalate dehydrogenase family protein [Myxococcales bacterium]|nr:isocitrate/isopropylmalate dehydrogenase family protein [Myxococcales bacterium]